MKLGPREITFLVVLAAVPVAAWFFVFQPRNHDIAQSRREITAMEATLTRLDRLAGAVGDVRTAIDEAEGRLADFRRNIPDAEEVDDLLAEMHRIGDRNSLRFASIRAANQAEVQGHLEIPLNMEVRGDFPGIYRFLVDLERLPRIVRVQSLEMERHMTKGRNDDEDRSQGDLDVAVTVVVYCEGEGGEA